MAAPLNAPAQSTRDRGVDLITHKFRPVSPESLAPARPAATSQSGIGASAVGQIRALQLDKAARRPAQKKISSKLIYTARMMQGQPAAPGVPYLNTGVEVDDNGNLLVDITADFTDDFLDRLRATGAHVLTAVPAYRGLRAMVPANQLETIAAWLNVIAIAPKRESMTAGVIAPAGTFSGAGRAAPGFEQRAARVRNYLASVLPVAASFQRGVSSVPGTPAATGQGSVTTEGDLTHRAFDARQAFGINGAGLQIGVLSDGVSSLSASQATGDLPPTCPAGPPCITVLPGQTGSGDEGTAMLEIIYDMAPGAKLYFATADNSLESFAQNIHDLRTAGCDIIVDDVFYFIESPFADGQTAAVPSPQNSALILQAVNDVTADGALYFAHAGNQGNKDMGSSSTYESDFVDGGALAVLGAGTGTVHNFGTAGSPVLWDQIVSPSGHPNFLFWSDPLGASTNDYDLYVLDPTATTVVDASTDIQDGSAPQDPVESVCSVDPTNPALSGCPVGYLLVVFKHTSAQSRYFHLNMTANGTGTLAFSTAGAAHGHSHAALAYSVAATPAAVPAGNTAPGPFPNFFTTANQIEFFSTDGPRRLFYQADGTPYTPGNVSSTGGIVRQKPDITAADGVFVTGVGGFGSPFYGTSAAAPSAAAVAALVKSAKPTLTNDELRTTLTTTALDIMASGVDRDSGAGIVMAFEAVKSLGVPGSANPELGDITATDNPGNGNGLIEAGEGGRVTINLKNTGGVVDATAITATLTSSTPGVTVTLPGTSTYANMPALSATQFTNVSPFTFTLASDYPCGQTASFTLTLNYTGGPSPRVLTFTVPTGPQVNITTILDATAPTPVTGVTTATGTLTGQRISRNGVASTCATTPKAFPGYVPPAGSRTYDGYTFTAAQNTCTTVTMSSTNGINLYTAAYSPNVTPSDVQPAFYADAGFSSSVESFGMSTTAGQTYTIIVHDVPPGAASGSTYNLQFSGCAFVSGTPNHPPIARAYDVTVAVGAGGTASASIDNGSSDPDGDPLTITQSPPGPYPLGTTNVLLTVVDTKGATSQTTANVTVVTPVLNVVPDTTTPPAVKAGQSATVHLTISSNVNLASQATLSCTTTAPLTTCQFNPPSPAIGTVGTVVTATIQTTGPNASNRMPLWPGRSKLVFATLLGLPMLVFMVPLVGRRRDRKLHGVWPWMGFLLLVLLLLLAGCGSSGGMQAPATPAGMYNVQITVGEGVTQVLTNINLTVTQ